MEHLPETDLKAPPSPPMAFPALCLLLLFFLSAISGWGADWKNTLTPPAKSPFPTVRPFEASFVFGWSNVFEAGTATARMENVGADSYRVGVQGKSTGLARALWQLDASYEGDGNRLTLLPRHFSQLEKYSKRKIEMEAIFEPEGVWRLRQGTPGNPAKWKQVRFPNLRDLVATMLFIRSQPLEKGDVVSVVAYPGDSMFLAKVRVLSKGKLNIAGRERDAIKLDLNIQRVVMKGPKKGQLEPHPKFKGGTVWISNDADRVPLRVEVNIFIGYVYGELTSLKFLHEAAGGSTSP